MKSLHRGGIAGNVKLKGKKTKTLSCGCCTVENFKEEYENKQAEKEIREVCPRCNIVHDQDPVDPDQILRDQAYEIAREIDRQALEKAGVQEVFNTGREAYFKVKLDFTNTFKDQK